MGLFERTESEVIDVENVEWQKSVLSLGDFSRVIKMAGFAPFTSAEASLSNMNDVSEGLMNSFLQDLLLTYLPKGGKGCEVGVADPALGASIQSGTGVAGVSNKMVRELIRGVRLHFDTFISELDDGDIEKAQLGLGHAFSRAKVKFNVNRVDNMIIQSIAMLDVLDKDLNQFAMRAKEWYSWHFPELVRIVSDNVLFNRCVLLIGDKSTLTEDSLEALENIVGDDVVANTILVAARASMGQEISQFDLSQVQRFAERVVSLAEYRAGLHDYLQEKMNTCAPNLAALIGEMVGARLIAHAGSLTNLAKLPASTIQILGAEKALFRALSNKAAIATRLDAFSDVPTSKFGEMLRNQMEERLEFYSSGTAPRKNKDVM